jgi:hypothetical protein
MNIIDNQASTGSLGKVGSRFSAHRRPRNARSRVIAIYQITDRLHDGRTARVPGDQVGATVSAWLAELDVHSPLVDDLSRAVRAGDWPATHAIGDWLSVDVTVAA